VMLAGAGAAARSAVGLGDIGSGAIHGVIRVPDGCVGETETFRRGRRRVVTPT
jgi:hypothetical protein